MSEPLYRINGEIPSDVWNDLHRRVKDGSLVKGSRRRSDAESVGCHLPRYRGPEYTGRNLISPHCDNHLVQEELEMLWNAAVGGRWLEDTDE